MEIKKITTLWDVNTFITNLFKQALEYGVSDIHFEPQANNFFIKFRINWDLLTFYIGPNYEYEQLVVKIKILANLKIDEKRLPQWGQFSFENTDFRVATVASLYGEKVVIRILEKNKDLLDIKKLGYSTHHLNLVQKALKKTYWLIAIWWPTWSWKTTTLYAMLNQFRWKNLAVYTLEDPIEYKIPWITQIQVRPEIGFTYYEWLKQLLRLDPDVILVGEIRDPKVAKLAVEASMTWHLVLTTIHANNTQGVVQRFLEFWIDKFILANSLILLMGQRLVKKLCDCKNCKNKEDVEELYYKPFLGELNNKFKNQDFNVCYPNWCEKCFHTGYSWRLPITEVVYVDDLVKKLILWNKLDLWYKMMQKNWYLTLFQDWLIKSKWWLTSLEQILPYKTD